MIHRLPEVGLIRACDDEQLFGFPLWPAQREILAGIEAGPRMHVLALGRRSGKTTCSALVGLWDCLLRPEVDRLVRPGERRYSVCVATSLRQARLFVAAARSIVLGSSLLRPHVVSETDDEIVFSNGACLAAFPCTARGVRGWAISSLLFDEAAHFISDSDGPAVAERVFAALAPALAQFGDQGRAIVASTPFGSEGWFSELYARCANGEIADARVVCLPTASVNPTIDAGFLAHEKQRDPESFRSEYEAEFIGGGQAFLNAESIAAAVTLPRPLEPDEGVGWIAGLDPAFSSDPFGLCIVGRDRHEPGRLVLGLARAWKPLRSRASFDERRGLEDAVLAEVGEICNRYAARAVTDQYASRPIIDRLREYGLRCKSVPMTAATKTQAFVALRGRLVTGGLALYEEPDLLAELRRLRSQFRAGSAGVVNPRIHGSHGDLAQALALAVFEARGPGRPGSVFRSSLEPLRIAGLPDDRFNGLPAEWSGHY